MRQVVLVGVVVAAALVCAAPADAGRVAKGKQRGVASLRTRLFGPRSPARVSRVRLPPRKVGWLGRRGTFRDVGDLIARARQLPAVDSAFHTDAPRDKDGFGSIWIHEGPGTYIVLHGSRQQLSLSRFVRTPNGTLDYRIDLNRDGSVNYHQAVRTRTPNGWVDSGTGWAPPTQASLPSAPFRAARPDHQAIVDQLAAVPVFSAVLRGTGESLR